ncbi:MAG: Outer membrane protein assembly factor BamB [Candidatus Dichloromethanomonas elyunquensis]|nr:MAG: Outer membrane protein assembly factor BamB [Candidatus Dichloromethanomonas elyunquensis]
MGIFKAKTKIGICFLVIAIYLVTGTGSLMYAQELPTSRQSILGEISAQPRFEVLSSQQQTLLLPTNSGLYLIQDGVIVSHLLPGKEVTFAVVVLDLDSDGTRDMVISVKDDLQPNVYCLSSRTGQVLWWFSPDAKVFAEGFGWFTGQPEINELIPSSGKDDQYIYVSAGNTLYKIWVADGNVVWEHSEQKQIVSSVRILDVDGDKEADLCISSQSGEIITLGAQSGKELWRQKNKTGFFFIRNFTNDKAKLLFNDKHILALRENGIIEAYNPADGRSVWRKDFSKERMGSIHDLQNQYIGKIDGDEYPDFIITSEEKMKVLCLNGKTGDIIWESDLTGSVKKIFMAAQAAKKTLLIINPSLSNIQRYLLLDMKNGKKVQDGIIPLAYAESAHSAKNFIAADSLGRIVAAFFLTEVCFFDNELKYKVWSMPKLRDAGFLQLNNETKESLLLFSSVQENGGEKIARIRKISQNGRTLWEYNLDPSWQNIFGGLPKIQIAGDCDKDGVNDIVGGLSSPKTLEPSKIITLSGNTGNVLWQTDLQVSEEINSLFCFDDVNADGISEVIAGTPSHFFILDGAGGKILKTWPHFNLKDNTYFGPSKGLAERVILLPAADVNKDGIRDIFVISPHQIRLGLTSRINGIDFYSKDLQKLSQGEYDLERANLFSDLDHDGVPELILKKKSAGNKTEVLLVSGSSGYQLASLTGTNPILQEAAADFNHNGTRDVLYYDQTESSGAVFKILEGSNGNVLWNYSGFNIANEFRDSDQIPGCVTNDLNGDGTPEFAVVKNTNSGTGLVIEIFDIAGGWEQPYKTLVLQQQSAGTLTRSWSAGYSLQKIVSQNKSYLAVVGRFGGMNEGTKLILYDEGQQVPIGVYPISAKKFSLNHEGLIAEDFNGKVSLWNFSNVDSNIQIVNRSSSPIRIEWQNRQEFVRTRILVDNVLASETKAEDAILDLTSGEHFIGIAQYTMDGKYTYQSFQVNVVKNTVMQYVVFGVSTAFIMLVFVLPFIIRHRMRAGARNV